MVSLCPTAAQSSLLRATVRHPAPSSDTCSTVRHHLAKNHKQLTCSHCRRSPGSSGTATNAFLSTEHYEYPLHVSTSQYQASTPAADTILSVRALEI